MEREKRIGGKMKKAIATLCLSFLFLVGATFGVLAATSQTVKTNFNVSYTMNAVFAEVSATYKKAGDQTATDFKATDGKTTKLIFNENGAQKGTTLSASDITLDATTNKSVTFIYTFKNTFSTTSNKEITISLVDKTTVNNATVTYTIGGDASDKTEYSRQAGKEGSLSFKLAPTKTATVTVVCTITDITTNAAYASTASTGLAWTIQA